MSRWRVGEFSSAPRLQILHGCRYAYLLTRFPNSLIAPLLLGGFGLSLVLTEVAGWIPMPDFIEEIFREPASEEEQN